MSSKRYLGIVVACVPIALILVTAAILLNNNNNSSGINIKEEGWANIAEMSGESLTKYFENYKEMRKDTDPDNILMVTSKTRPETYGAVGMVEAPNHLYLLKYENIQSRDAAFDSLISDGVIVEKNQTYHVAGNDDYLSWGVYVMKLNDFRENINEIACDPEDAEEDYCVSFSKYVEDDGENDYEVNFPTVTVAVIDTGMDEELFDGHFSDRTLDSWCVTECDDDLGDISNEKHGTHVGGTVAEATADNVNLLAIRATDDPAGNFVSTDIITAIDYAVAEGADVINMSLGGPVEAVDTSMMIALQAADDAGIVNIASAGNDNVSTLYYPASFDNTISVAALSVSLDSEAPDGYVLSKWEDSNYGEKIDVTAPGDGINGINGSSMSGTSMAAPHIAAFVANLKTLNKNLDREDVLDIMKRHAEDLGEEGWDEYYGFGMPQYFDICSKSDCDAYGALESGWLVDSKGSIVALFDDTIQYALTADELTITSESPLVVFSDDGSELTRIASTGTDNTRVFSLDGVKKGATIYVELVGDVNADGKTDADDALLIDRSELDSSDSDYVELTGYQKLVADVNNSGNVNLADSLLIDYSKLPQTNPNYQALEW